MTLARTQFKRTVPSAETKPVKGPRQRKCSNCGDPFVQSRMGQKVCSPACAQSYGRRISEQQQRKKVRQERAETKAKLKTRSDWMKEAQASLNSWIRLVRDRDLPCISCGRHHEGQYHAGHFLSRGSHPHLALLEINLAKQCQPCNVHLSGNQLAYRRGLIERVGLLAVELLESDMTPRKYTIDDLKAIKSHYKQLLKESSC